MKLVLDDGGREAAGFKGYAGDCAARSIAIATGIPYAEVYAGLAALHKRTKGKRTAREGIFTKDAKKFLEVNGWKWTPTMTIGSGCRVHLAKDELPSGRLVVRVAKHYTAVIDGVIHDTFDPNDRGASGIVGEIGLVEWKEPGPRCVYGYFSKEEDDASLDIEFTKSADAHLLTGARS